MGKGDELSRKKYFHLCWEYLKRSDDYREFCEWRQGLDIKIPPLNNLNKVPLPKKFQSITPGKVHPFLEIYHFWGAQIFSGDFDSWWKLFEEGNRLLGPVVPFTETIDEYFEGIRLETKEDAEQVLNSLKKTASVFPLTNNETIEEIIAEYHRIVMKKLIDTIDSYPRIFLDIRIDRSISIEKLQKEIIKAFRKELKNKLETRKWVNGIWFYPNGPNRFSELERYLKIFSLKKEGKQYRQIASEVYPKKFFDENLRRVLNKEWKKAQRIIRNVEMGVFPGKY